MIYDHQFSILTYASTYGAVTKRDFLDFRNLDGELEVSTMAVASVYLQFIAVLHDGRKVMNIRILCYDGRIASCSYRCQREELSIAGMPLLPN